jgi:hypothetical protein
VLRADAAEVGSDDRGCCGARFARHARTSGHLGHRSLGRAYTQIKSLTCSAQRPDNFGHSVARGCA